MRILFNAICMAMLLVCCRSTPEVKNDPPVRSIETRISFGGDINLGPEFPIYSAGGTKLVPGSDIYAIQIYSKAKSPSSATYKAFAYGLFDDLDKVAIALPDNMFYRIAVTMVEDGRRVIYSSSGEFRDPFAVGARYLPITNSFAETSATTLTGIFIGKATVVQGTGFGYATYTRPAIGRYAGESVDFEPAVGRDIEVELKYVDFGVRLSAIGLKEGHIELNIEGSPVIKLTPEQDSVDVRLSLAGSVGSNIWLEDNYSETIIFKAKWVRADKSELVLGPPEGKSMVVKRRFIFPIITRVTWDQTDSSITIKDEEMIDQPETIF